MPLRIPLPTQGGEALQRGVEHGASMFSNLLGQGIQRQQLGQSWQQHLHNLALQQQQEERMQQAAQLAAQLHPLQKQHLMSQIEAQRALTAKRRFESDPAAQTTYLQNLLNGLGGMQQQMGAPQSAQPAMAGAMPQFNELQRAIIKKTTGIDLTPKDTPAMKAERDISTAGQKERSKLNEKYRAGNLESIEAAQDSLADLNQAKELLGQPGTPEYDFATSALGPVDARIPALRTGTRQFRGEFERLAGRMKANIARLEKGATSDKERAMIDKAEITDTDSWTIASGKLLAQEKYLKRLIERKTQIAEMIDLGYPREKAIEMAMKATPFANENKSSKTTAVNEQMLKGVLNGKEVSIHPSRRKQFEERGGQIR